MSTYDLAADPDVVRIFALLRTIEDHIALLHHEEEAAFAHLRAIKASNPGMDIVPLMIALSAEPDAPYTTDSIVWMYWLASKLPEWEAVKLYVVPAAPSWWRD